MRKILFTLLAAALLLMLFLGTSTAETDGDWTFEIQNGAATITKYTGADEIVEIPAALGGVPVTALACKAFEYANITEVILPDSVTTLEEYGAFFYCTSLQAVTLPDSLVNVSRNPFIACPKLETIRISDEHPALEMIDGVLFNKAEKSLLWFPKVNAPSEYEVPEGVKAIAPHGFDGALSLMSITLPDTVTEIGEYAFYQCKYLKSIVIPAGVSVIAEASFQSCANLEIIVFPAGVTQISDSAFSGCHALTEVTLPDTVVSIGSFAFSDALQRIYLPASITYIDSFAFYGCDHLTAIVDENSYAHQFCVDHGIPFEFAQNSIWICPDCGRENDNNYCPFCGAARPAQQ